ncbi:WbqC family protein [Trinickia violacea]|nr:WbqC family protein [Trinickia violacea]
MRLGIMQPYFFPYLGHFALIAAVDEWIVFDVTQYTPKTWMNRNRILHPKEGWQYVTVPLSNSSITIKTREARVLNVADTKTSLRGKLSAFRRQAPFFAQVDDLVCAAFDRTSSDSLCELNVNTLKAVCEYLGVPFSYRVCSELSLDFPSQMGAGDWAPLVCQQLGATEYVNPAGGRALFDPATFTRAGVTLKFAEFDEFSYDPAPYRYEPHLSIIDVLLWNAPETVAQALRSHTRCVA